MFDSLFIYFILMSACALLAALFPLRHQKKQVSFIALALIGASSLCYWQWGGWAPIAAYQQTLTNQAKVQAMLQSIHGPEELIDRLKKHLNEHATSAKGWYLLGRLYSQHQPKEALSAFERAYRLKPNNPTYVVNYAKSLFESSPEQAEKARQILNNLLKTTPAQPDALAMLAWDAYNQHRYQAALQYWRRLLLLLPPTSEEAVAVRKAIAALNLHP